MRKASLFLFPTLLALGCGNAPTVAPGAPSPIGTAVTSVFTLSGTVFGVAPAGSQTLQGARVRVHAGSAVFETATDECGYYTLAGLSSEVWKVTVEMEGYETVERSLRLRQNTVMNFDLAPPD